MRIHELVPLLNVADVPRSVAFYRDALGFEVARSFEQGGRMVWARLTCGVVELMLNQHGELSDARRRREPYRDVVLYLSVDSADDVHKRLAARGFAPGKLNDEDYGVREFQLRDPDGYEIAVTSPLKR